MNDRIQRYDADLYKYEEKIALLSQEVERLTGLSERYQFSIAEISSKLEGREKEIR